MSINEQNVLNIAKIVPIIDGTQTITYDNSVSGLSSTTVQNAITENAGNISSINSTLSIYEPNGSDGSNVINVTGNITLTAADSGKTLVFWGNISAAITVTLPTGSQGIWFELGPSNYNIVLHSPINVYNENNTVICSPNGTYTIPGTGIFGSTTKIVYDGGAAAYYAKQSSFPNFSNVTVSGTLNIQNATTSNEAVNLGQMQSSLPSTSGYQNSYYTVPTFDSVTSSKKDLIVQTAYFTTSSSGFTVMNLPASFTTKILGFSAVQTLKADGTIGYYTPQVKLNGTSLSSVLVATFNGTSYGSADVLCIQVWGF